METSNEPFIIQKSNEYSGLNAIAVKPLDTFVLDEFVWDDLFQFPLLCEIPKEIPGYKVQCVYQKKMANTLQEINGSSPFQVGQSEGILNNLEKDSNELQQSFTSNSISKNLDSADNSLSNLRPNISFNTKEAIMNIHRDYTTKRDDEAHLNSITPVSSFTSQLELTESSQDFQPKVVSAISSNRPSENRQSSNYASMNDMEGYSSSQDLFLFPNEEDSLSAVVHEEVKHPRHFEPILEMDEITEVNSCDEIAVSGTFHETTYNDDSHAIMETKQSYIVDLMPESSNEYSSFMYCSNDAIAKAKLAGISLQSIQAEDHIGDSEEEGTLKIEECSRVFLSETASKNRLTIGGMGAAVSPAFVRIPQKISDTSIPDISNCTVSMDIDVTSVFAIVSYPDTRSPLYRKMLIYTQTKSQSQQILQLQSANSCTGFTSSPQLVFSNVAEKNRARVCEELKPDMFLDNLVTFSIWKIEIATFSCGFEHSAAITRQGELYTWGYGPAGCLGQGDILSRSEPTKVNNIEGIKYVYLECGAYHNAALTSEGEVYTWGRGDVHQLGQQFSKLKKDDMGFVALRPMRIKTFETGNVKAIACGEAHTLALDINGYVYAFGWAEDGQLGLPDREIKDNIMTTSICRVKQLKQVAKISCGSIFSTAVTTKGQVYTWGNGEHGQLGQGVSVKQCGFPSIVSSLVGEVVTEVLCGDSHVICLTDNGKLYGWGQGVAGDFQNVSDEFVTGAELVCFVPRQLYEAEILSHYLVK